MCPEIIYILRSVRCYFFHQLSQHREVTAFILKLWVFIDRSHLLKNCNKGQGILSMIYEEKAFNKKQGF